MYLRRKISLTFELIISDSSRYCIYRRIRRLFRSTMCFHCIHHHTETEQNECNASLCVYMTFRCLVFLFRRIISLGNGVFCEKHARKTNTFGVQWRVIVKEAFIHSSLLVEIGKPVEKHLGEILYTIWF